MLRQSRRSAETTLDSFRDKWVALVTEASLIYEFGQSEYRIIHSPDCGPEMGHEFNSTEAALMSHSACSSTEGSFATAFLNSSAPVHHPRHMRFPLIPFYVLG